MKKILPFKGILYNPDKIESMSDVVTPPYDVISPEMQEELYGRSPYNFCRVDLTRETGDERYAIAGKVYARWLSEQVLIQEKKPAIFVHHQTFRLPDGQKVTRRGFFAARRLEDFSQGGVKPHEKTLEAPRMDRLKLTRATEAQLSPVFSLYADPGRVIEEKLERLVQTTPLFDFVTKDGERHELWKLTDTDVCNFIDEFLAGKSVFIADGHHRYETALNYRGELVEKQGDLPENAGANFVLMYLSNMNDKGLVILPIHRALHDLRGFSMADLLEKLAPWFEVRQVPATDVEKNLGFLKETGREGHAFWVLTRDPGQSYLISMDPQKWRSSRVAQGLPPSLSRLDVTVLHQLIFADIMGLSEESQARQENLVYWKSTDKAIAETRQGRCDLTFILNPTRIEDMEAVALAGEKMPQKSTYFYPKILSGLVVHSVRTGETDGQ